MRVLYIENGSFGGGSAESLLQLVKGINRGDFQPFVAFTSEIRSIPRFDSARTPVFLLNDWYLSRTTKTLPRYSQRLFSYLIHYGATILPTVSLDLERLVTSAPKSKLVALIKSTGAGLVHTNNNPHRDLWAIEAASLAGVPCVSHLRSFHGFGFTKERAALANKYATAFIAYSKSISEYWIGLGLNPAKVETVPNAIEETFASPADVRSMFDVNWAGPMIGLIGRIIPERGHQLLIEALPNLRREFPNIVLFIVGDGDAASVTSLKRLTNNLGLNRSVVFTGHREDAHSILKALDVLVLPYSIEPFGRTLLEAWQLEVPVVLSQVGHISDIVADGKNGYLFDPNSPSDLTLKLTTILSDPGLREQLAKSGRETCLKRYSVDAHCRNIEKIYRNALHAH